MNNHTTNSEILRKRNSRMKETAEQREARLTRERERKRKKRADETDENRDARLASNREYKRQRISTETSEERKKRLNRESKQKRILRVSNNQRCQKIAKETDIRPKSQTISEEEHQRLQNFRNKMDNIRYNSCIVCNERIPSMILVKEMCRRCSTEKTIPKRFSKENNMDPGVAPEELKGLTEIEEMLIAQVFTVMTVYRLRGGQNSYRGNVINFPQDIHEFTTRLPRHPSSLDVLVIRRQSANDSTGFRDFIVRRNKVANALLWLKANNCYYKEVIIDHEILKSLPENDSIVKQLPQLQNDQIIDKTSAEESDDSGIARTFVPSSTPTRREDVAINDTIDRMENNNPPLLWPEIDGYPINEFQTPGYMARAFPTLYPYGDGDFRSERPWNIKPAEYFKHLMWYKDGRFARHPRWRYFALNSTMRWRALQEGKVYVKQKLSDEQINITDIQEMIATGDKNLADKIMRYGEGLRGSRQFWMARRNELSDFIKQIGHQGLVFFTFSAADLHWPELHKLMPDDGNSEESTSAKKRQQNLIDNPHIAAWFFDKRFDCFFHDVLEKQLDFEDYWYRYEWQHRGSVHVHGIAKIRNAPIINWNDIKSNENDSDKMINITNYVDSIVTTINPNIFAAIPERHPCQKGKDELDDSLQDYIELINKLQRHTRCSSSYCIRVNRGKQSCRFGYPKDHIDHTLIREDDRGQPELITARNDPLINPHNRLQLQGWRANIDLKPILSIYAALQYISKYASKGEPRSMAFSEIFNQILNNSNPDDASLTSIQKLLLSSVAERDISAQETCHLLLGIPLYHSSRTFVSLNINEESARWVQGSGSSSNGEKGRTTQSVLNRYWNRPEQLEEFSLFKLHLTHKLINGTWQKCKKENIVRIWPRPSPLRNGDQWEEFCRVKVLLHVQHRSLQQLKENDSVSWSSLYDQHLDVINSDPADLLGPPIDNEDNEEVPDEESQDEPLEDDEEMEFRYDWMHLSEMGPNANIVCSLDLGSRDMDRNYDWIHETQQRYSSDDIEKACNFVHEVSNNTIDDLGKDDNSIDYESLNENQKAVFNRIESHYNNILTGSTVEPLRIIIMGTAGTGKSYLIKAIRKRLNTMERDKSKVPMKVIAPTGVAAFNINGATIHSTLSIPIFNNKCSDLNSNRLKQLQERLKNVIYLIIDEKSMVGRRMLALVDKRLREAFPENKNEPFGGRSIILFGDFGQLPPVLDLPMYADNVSHDMISNDGIVSYKNFQEVYQLDVIQRQSGDSEEQKGFREILLRLRDGDCSLDDWKKLSTRFEGKLDRIECNKFSDAVFILTLWADVDRVNTEMLRSLNRPVVKILAVHTGGREAKKANSDVAKGLEAQLLLAKGARVMLTANLWTEGGLVNGSMGTIHDIIFVENGPPSLPAAVFVKFDLYEGPSITTPEGDKVVPIVPIKRTWESKSGTICSRLQVPLYLAWAITVHKSQGLTLPKAKIDLGSKEFAAGLSFVAVSRVRSLDNIYFKPFTFERLQRIQSCRRLQERKAEEERLLSIISRE